MAEFFAQRLAALRRFELERFARVSTQGSTVREIDGLRFFAFTLVYLLHLSNYVAAVHYRIPAGDNAARRALVSSSWLTRGALSGEFGVDVFFAISGFILILPFARAVLGQRQAVALPAYYLRRVTRLEPPYIINLTLVLIAKSIREGGIQSLLPHFFAAVFYVNNAVYHDYNRINPVQWSLEIEVQFYVLVPLLALLLKAGGYHARMVVLAALAFGFAALNQFVFPERIVDIPVARMLPGHLHFFMVGLILGNWFLERRPEPAAGASGWAWDIAGWGIWFAIFSGDLHRVCPPFLIPAPLCIACMAAFKAPLLNAFLCTTEIYLLGGMCYTFYLYHQFVLAAAVRGFAGLHGAAWPLEAHFAFDLLLATPVVIAVCATLFVLFERPFMRAFWQRPGGSKRAE